MPDSDKFRQRNRIVSGLSISILIVEAQQKSGTAITANYARKQGKEIFCIPSSIENKKGIGTNNQIKKGAHLVQLPTEIIERYGKVKNKELIMPDDFEKSTEKIEVNTKDILKEYEEIYKILNEPLNVNEISIKTKESVTEVYSKLFLMELDGLIKQQGNKYVIT